MTNIIFFVTTVLVVGYSYQDNYILVAASPGSGWDVAWVRSFGCADAACWTDTFTETFFTRYRRRVCCLASLYPKIPKAAC